MHQGCPTSGRAECSAPRTGGGGGLRTHGPRSGGAHLVDGQENAWRSRAPGPHAHGNAARQVVDGPRTEVCGQQEQSNDPRNNQHNPQYANYWPPLPRKRHIRPHPAQPRHTNHWALRGNDTSKSTGRSGRQKAATRRNMRREERVTVQGPVKKQPPDGMSHRAGGGGMGVSTLSLRGCQGQGGSPRVAPGTEPLSAPSLAQK